MFPAQFRKRSQDPASAPLAPRPPPPIGGAAVRHARIGIDLPSPHPIMRTNPFVSAAAAVLLLAGAAAAQRVGDVPPRPALDAAADTNDARAYYDHGVRRLMAEHPRDAAAAFYWAHQIEPAWSAPLYGRYVAMLMTDARRLVRYWEGDRRTARSSEMVAIDSLYLRALTLDPFLYRRFEKDLIRFYLTSRVIENSGSRQLDRAALDFNITVYLRQHAGPYTRGVVAYGEGRFPETLRLWDESLRRSRRRSFIRTERGRLFAHVGNNPSALEEFGHALTEMRREDERDLIYIYESKALLEHSVGMLHERMGDRGAAREAYGRALQEDLSFAPAHVRLAHLALEDADTASAMGSYALAVEIPTIDAHTRLQYAHLLMGSGDMEGAEAQLRAASASAPHYAMVYLVRALVSEARGDGEGAMANLREFLDRAVRNDPRRPAAAQRLQVLGDLVGAAPGGEGR
jgi:hypothetical protein